MSKENVQMPEYIRDIPDIFNVYWRWVRDDRLCRKPGGWLYKGKFYPDYLTVGGAGYAIFPMALEFCIGKGIDHGCGFWPLPGSIPVDIRGPGAENNIDVIAEGSLDYVFSSHFLEHVEDWLDCLSKWNFLLKDRGKLFVYLPHPDCELWHRGSPMIGEGHRWIPASDIVVTAIEHMGFRVLDSSNEPDGMQSFYVVAEKKKSISTNEDLRIKLGILERLPNETNQNICLANLAQTFSGSFVGFMGMLNAFARKHGLRHFSNWSKVWEYPWSWFNGLAHVDWDGTNLLDLGSELSPMPWFLASLGASVMLVEKDKQWISTWENLRSETGLDVNWVIIDNENLPFQSRLFDVVTSFSVIEHQLNKLRAIDEVGRILKPGGLLAISFDICEPEMGMTFPEWNGAALTMKEFEKVIWDHPEFDTDNVRPDWNVSDIPEFIAWHLQSASHHNYTVGAAILRKRDKG